MEPVVVIGIIFLVWLAFTMASKKAKAKVEPQQGTEVLKRADAMVEAACQFIAQVNTARGYPDVAPGDVSIPKGEFAILREAATLFEQKSHRVGSAVGTRVKVGKLPVYLGSSHSSTYETTDPIASGELVITNRRMIFLADTRSATIQLKDAVGIKADISHLIIHSAKRKSPYVFAVSNPVLWSLIAKIGASHPLESRFIPDGVTFKARPTGTPGEVNFEALTDPHAVGIA